MSNKLLSIGAWMPDTRMQTGTVSFTKHRQNLEGLAENANYGGTQYYRFKCTAVDGYGGSYAAVEGKPEEGLVSINAATVKQKVGHPRLLEGSVIEVDESDFNNAVRANVMSERASQFPMFNLVFTHFHSIITLGVFNSLVNAEVELALAQMGHVKPEDKQKEEEPH